MQELAKAKVNLALHITGRRADGYHLLESLVAFADVHDVVSAVPVDQITLSVVGEFAKEAGEGEGNLVLKAAKRLQATANIAQGAALTLEKNIPVGAGLGGGSADAAATMRLLNRFWNVGYSDTELTELARPIGADVAICIASAPAIVTGIGDELTPLGETLPSLHAVMAHPRIPLLTPDVYRALKIPTETKEEKWKEISSYSILVKNLHASRNDLQEAACHVSPVVTELLTSLQNLDPAPDLVRMTGSGACCFALYETQQDAMKAATVLQAQHPKWWVRSARIG